MSQTKSSNSEEGVDLLEFINALKKEHEKEGKYQKNMKLVYFVTACYDENGKRDNTFSPDLSEK